MIWKAIGRAALALGMVVWTQSMALCQERPSPCWCWLDLVPDAGATTVSLTVAALEGDPAPDIDSVRDEWVANLNRLGDL